MARKKEAETVTPIFIIKAENREIKRGYGRRQKGDSKLVIYCSRIGKTVLDDLTERHFDLTKVMKSHFAEILHKAGRTDLLDALANGEIRLKWDQYAGCSCPCSPGFVVKKTKGSNYYVKPGMIFVDFSLAPMTEKTKQIVKKPMYRELTSKEVGYETPRLPKVLVPAGDQNVLPGLVYVKSSYDYPAGLYMAAKS